jgi:predicted ATPase with chaperone activity
MIPKSHALVRTGLSQNIGNEFLVHCSIALIRRSCIEVPHVDYQKLSGDRLGESSVSIRARVQTAREIQRARFSSLQSQDIVCNADMRIEEIRQFCKWPEEGQSLMPAATYKARCVELSADFSNLRARRGGSPVISRRGASQKSTMNN